MAEWFKAQAWKACILLKVSWVRIPLSPPFNLTFSIFKCDVKIDLMANEIKKADKKY